MRSGYTLLVVLLFACVQLSDWDVLVNKVQLQKGPIQMILTPTLMNVPRQHQVPAGVREDEEDNHEEEENSKKDR